MNKLAFFSSRLFVSVMAAMIVFVIKFAADYNNILVEQVSDRPTSFPPSAAWMTALPWAILTFALVFIVCWLFFKK